MFLFGAVITRCFAMLAAVMTVTTGVPSLRCVCPDGRVNVSLLGTTSCCCTKAVSVPFDPNSGSHKLEAVASPGFVGSVKKHACCDRSEPAPTNGKPGGTTPCSLHSAGCSKSFVAVTGAFTIENEGAATQALSDIFAAWLPLPVFLAFQRNASPACGPTPSSPPSPDLVIAFCHFTC